MKKFGLFISLFLFCISLPAQTSYDLLLKGGHVIDPKNNINSLMDVAIVSGKIARVAANIPAAEAQKVVDVRGLYVTPGIFDMHVHVYAGTGVKGAYAGDQSVYPDGFTFRTGVTTVVDAGTSGWRTFPDFKDRIIDRARTRVLAMVNIVGHGMGGGPQESGHTLGEQNMEDMDAAATAKIAKQYPQIIVGIKAAHFNGPEWTFIDRAVQAGKLANLPVMVDFGLFLPQRPFEEMVTTHLRPGDISTHMYRADEPILDKNGKVRSYLFEARKRGVKFDVGHGGGAFLWNQAVPSMQQGWIPDTISTDLHTGSMNGGGKDMPTTMSKILNLGVSLFDVVKMSTIAPAELMKRPELGNLSPGAGADVTVFQLEKGQFGFLDVRNARFTGTQKLVCMLTIRDGRVMYDLNGIAGEDWEKFYANPKNTKAGGGR